jgi:apolipoprotein N-acyltransferase
VGAVLSALAFPPFGPGVLIPLGVALFLAAARSVSTPRRGFLAGFLYGTLFIGLLMWWLVRLDWTALALAPLQGVFFGALGWWLARHRSAPPMIWVVFAVGGWALMELIRYRIPYGGMEWGAAGYALSDNLATRFPAVVIGVSGLTVLVVVVAAIGALALTGGFHRRLWWGMAGVLAVYALAGLVVILDAQEDVEPLRAVIVQGSTPCPFERCPPDQRLGTYNQHLELTRTIEAGSVDLVVWPEGSLGSFNADPVQNPEVGEAIGAEARRLGAWLLVGTDRPVSDTHWVNANVLFNPEGVIVGEYHKQLPVPFGEFIPFRTIFTRLIPELSRVPRDMIPGEGPVVFDLGPATLGSVISWEGGFSRYSRQHARQGANLMVVATNNDSYGADAPTSEVFIGMTRMRATELGLDLIHGAVTGKSVIIDSSGFLVSEVAGNGEQAIVRSQVVPRAPSLYAATGDVLMVGSAMAGLLVWWRSRRLVSFPVPEPEEE